MAKISFDSSVIDLSATHYTQPSFRLKVAKVWLSRPLFRRNGLQNQDWARQIMRQVSVAPYASPHQIARVRHAFDTAKAPEEWVSGDDPMTGAQASYLKTLSEEAGDPDAYDENLTKAEASKRIDALKQELGLE